MKKLTATALGLVALAALPLSASNWSDVFVGYQYSNQFRDPGLAGTQVKNRLELSGAAGWDYGTNFFDVNMLSATKSAPANTSDYPNGGYSAGQPASGVPGNTEVYVVYRSSFDLGKVFKTSMAFGPVREVDFVVGFDFDSQDNHFASNKKLMMAGPQFGFNIDHGFWNLGLGACREANYNGVVEKEVDFKTQYMVFTSWHKGFNMGVPVTFKGWANYVGPKGKDAFGNDTKAETVGDMYLMFDLSSLFGRKAGGFFVGPGFEYWNNKFGGKNFSSYPGANPYGAWQGLNNERTTALMLSAEIHF